MRPSPEPFHRRRATSQFSHPKPVLSAILAVAVALSLCLPAVAFDIDAPLKGIELRCCTLPEAPIVQRDNSTLEGFSGIAIEYLRLLELTLGFRCKSLNEYKSERGGNATFNEVIYNLENCSVNGVVPTNDPSCKCDIGTGGWSLNDNRIGRVDYVQPFAFDFYRVLTHSNNTVSPAGDVFFFTAFNATVWVCVFLLMFLFAFLKLLDVHFAPLPVQPMEVEPVPKGASRWVRYWHRFANTEHMLRLNLGFQSVVSHMMGHTTHDITGDTRTMRQWTLNVFIFLSGLFLVLTYEASMTNALVNEIWRSDFKRLEDFKNCRVPADEICITSGTGAHAFWKTAVETHPCHQGPSAPKAKTKETIDDTLNAFYNYECKYMVGLGVQLQEIAQGSHCGHVRLTGKPFRDTGVSFILPRDSNITDKLTNATLELRNADLIPTPERYLAREGVCHKEEFASISFVKLMWFFILVFFACFLILMVTACAGWRLRKASRKNAELDGQSQQNGDG